MARAVPHNLEAEMSVLGVAFISKDQIDKICESVTEDMFYDERLQEKRGEISPLAYQFLYSSSAISHSSSSPLFSGKANR